MHIGAVSYKGLHLHLYHYYSTAENHKNAGRPVKLSIKKKTSTN